MTRVVIPPNVSFPPIRGQMRFRIDLEGINGLSRAMRDPVNFYNIANRWSVNYFSYIQRRFRLLSRSGAFPPSGKPITRRAQRTKVRAKWGRKAALADTLTIYDSLTPTFRSVPRGQIREIRNPGPRSPGRLTLGIGGRDYHPRPNNQGKYRTIGQIATIHQFGIGANPRREIIVNPPEALIRNGVQKVTIRWMRELVAKNVRPIRVR